ncbi:hypothetical protein MKW94_000289, partial [Papaver nudicaule]|nr:hypothetical protein [Papaver nudicaule]
MAAVLGMGRMDGTVTKDNKLMGGGRWRNTDFFRRYFPKATGKKKASRTMIQDAILEILKRNKKKMKKVAEENEGSDESEDIEETEETEDNEETDESKDCDENEDDEDLVRLIGLFLCTAFFFTTKEADKLSEKYIGLVSDLERSRNVSWPDLIHNFLEEQLNKHMGDEQVKHTNGCVTYLLIWFAEHTHIVKPVNIRNKKEYIPRAARWNLTAICDALLKDMDTLEFE